MINKTRTVVGGSWPVMLTPFKFDKNIDWDTLDHLIEWYLAEGSKGLFAVCQSSEMFDLANDERISLARHVVKRVADRVPVIATGTFSENINVQAEFIKKIYDTGLEAVILLTNHLARQDESESVWKRNTERLLQKTTDIPLGVYECPAPYKRLIPPETMEWIVSTNRFYWSKDTSEDIDQIRVKLEITNGTQLSLYNAHVGSLLTSLRSGVTGFGGIDANFYPALASWLCDNWEKEPQTAEELQQFLSWGRKLADIKYPLSAKQYLVLGGVLKEVTSRVHREPFTREELNALKDLLQKSEMWYERLGLLVGTAVL